MNPKEKFLDRIEQSFMILIKQTNLLIWAGIVYGWLYIFTIILYKVFISVLIFDNWFFTHSTNYIAFIIGIIIWLILIILHIGILLGFIKHISDIVKWYPTRLQNSLLYGMKRIILSCYTYYYIFLYAYLVPSLFLIVGLSLILLDISSGRLNFGIWTNDMQYAGIWFILVGISLVLSIYFIIYRWTRSSLAIYNAIEKDDFSRASFEYSLNLTNNQWTRVFGNLVGMSILMGLALSIFNGLFSIGSSSLDMNFMNIIRMGSTTWMKNTMQGFSSIEIWSILSSILKSIGWLFSLTFTYLFFKRLEIESGMGATINPSTKINSDILIEEL